MEIISFLIFTEKSLLGTENTNLLLFPAIYLRNEKYNNLSSSKFFRFFLFVFSVFWCFLLRCFLLVGRKKRVGVMLYEFHMYIFLIFGYCEWGRAYIFIFCCTSFFVFCSDRLQSDPLFILHIYFFFSDPFMFIFAHCFPCYQAFCSSVLFPLSIFIIIIIYVQRFSVVLFRQTHLYLHHHLLYLLFKCVCFRCFLFFLLYYKIICVLFFILSNFRICSHNLCAFFSSFVFHNLMDKHFIVHQQKAF